MSIKNNPCEIHIKVEADGFCPICLIEERDRLQKAVDNFTKALDELQDAEYRYRSDHDVRGDGSLEAGRAWDNMRRCGNRARLILAVNPKETKCE